MQAANRDKIHEGADRFMTHGPFKFEVIPLRTFLTLIKLFRLITSLAPAISSSHPRAKSSKNKPNKNATINYKLVKENTMRDRVVH